MAATVAQAQATDIAPAAPTMSQPHVQNVSHNAAGQAPESLPPTRNFSPSDFKLVRTLGTGMLSIES